MPGVYSTNICFGGRDIRTVLITLFGTDGLAAMDSLFYPIHPELFDRLFKDWASPDPRRTPL
jgi:hypothetical protein